MIDLKVIAWTSLAVILVGCASSPKSEPLDPKSQNGRYLAACEVGDAKACLLLGDNYYEGVDVKANGALALRYYGNGCNEGNEEACIKHDKIMDRAVDAMMKALVTE